MLARILSFGNLILASANVIVGFSLLAYILTHNLRSPVARAFCALMAFVTIVYVVDIGVNEVDASESAQVWLRLQWVGIAFVPAAYFHFSDALLRTTGSVSRVRTAAKILSYALGLAFFGLVAFTGFIVDGVAEKERILHLNAGHGFWAFAVYYAITSLSGWLNISRARSRCLTSTSRRRMSYLMLAFVAPSAGVFPYLLIPPTGQYLSSNMILAVALVGNVGIALMTTVMGYIVAYQGVLLPDRVVKHSLVHYLLRGPLVAILVIAIMLALPRVEHILGLPRETVLIVTVAASVVILQVLINVGKPAIDRLIYRRDRGASGAREIAWIQTIDERLFTTTDLEQLLENTLLALCDLLRSPSGFVVTMQGARLALRVFCGERASASEFLARASLAQLMVDIDESRQDGFVSNADLVPADGHWLLPLRSGSDRATLGILGISATAPASATGAAPEYSDDDLEALHGLVRRAELALEDMRLQEQVFAVLRGLDGDFDQLQEWRSSSPFLREDTRLRQDTLQFLEVAPIHSPGFVQMVRDALSQFWGGPKLSQSPLVRMQVVRERLDQNDHVPAKAVRSVLREAIERLKPHGERSMMASEWIVYNILDLKFVQGLRIRDIVQRLAMSESDFYRKQRIAIEQVADTLAQMERTCDGSS